MWLLLNSIEQQIDKAINSGMQFSTEERATIELKSSEFGKMILSGRSAIIPIEGVLTEKRDFFAAFFGGGNTTYPDIIAAIEQAENSKDVDEIVYMVNTSPGGSVNGLFPAMDAIRDAKKPSKAIVRNMAASGAFGLVSQADQIIATNKGTQFGSVGVAYDTIVFDGDIKEVSVTSTEAPDKRPDPLTDEGKAVIRGQLDDVHSLFAGGIAKGRKTTVKDVNANYGRGAIVMANEALESGMIDGIQSADTDTKTTAIKSGNNTEVRSMDLKKLKAEHPAVFDEAVEIGSKEERDRVCAHLKMGEASGDMKTALGAIEDGSSMTATLMATYQAAVLNKASVQNREGDNQDGLDTPPAPDAKTADQKLDEEIAAKMGADEGEGVWL